MSSFDTVLDRRGTRSVKYDLISAKNYDPDTLPMWVADMDFRAPECVIRALHQAADYGVFGYTFVDESYFAAVKKWFARRFGWQVEKKWLVAIPGVVTALNVAVRSATEPGDSVMVQTPVYYPFFSAVTGNGRNLVENPLIYRDGKYSVDFEDMEKKIQTHRVKMLILCSPHNPVCRVWTRQELEKLGQICRKYGVTVVSDEIHCDFAFAEYPHTPFPIACPEMAQQCIVCTAPSKSFNLAGLQTSNIFIPNEQLRKKFLKEMEQMSIHAPNILGLIACQAAYDGAEQWLEECKAYMRENLNYLREFLREYLPKVRLVEPEGTYFAWLDCTQLGLSGEELNDRILKKGKLWLDGGGMFGQAAEKFQRIVLASPRANVEQTCRRLLLALGDAD